MRPASLLAILFSAATVLLAAQNDAPPTLVLAGKIPLPDVHGRIDHLAADIYNARIFVAALGNNTVEVLNIRKNAVAGSIHGMLDPQGVAYLKSSNRILVTNAGDGTLRSFDAAKLKSSSTDLHLGMDADNIRLNSSQDRIYVGYGSGAVAILDREGRRLAEIPVKGHPEAFQLAEKQQRLYINVPDAQSVVVADSKSARVIAEWPMKGCRENFPMALDETNRRLFVACRRPARLQVLDMDSGLVLTSLPTVGDADDLFFDPIHARLYVIGGLGQIAVYTQQSPDHYVSLDSISTSAGTRTALFVPEWNRLFVAVREFAGHPAEIRIYQPQ